MSQPPSKSASTGKKIETVIEKALDPLASALKRATQSAAQAVAAAPGKPGLMISPLAVPFPTIPPIGGVEIATARAGFYKHERDDLVVFRFPEGASCAGVFTRHKVGSAPVDWCKRHLDADKGGEGVKALVVNAGCANAFTGKAGADAARRTASEVAKRFDCRQRDVMLASTGVIGVVLDDKKITARLSDVEAGLKADAWAQAGLGIMTTDTFPKGSYAECEIEGVKVRIAGIAKGSGMIAPDMATMLAFIVTDADIAPPVLKALLNLHARTTFNSVTVDGDTSTNDTALLFATGASGAPRIGRVGDRRLVSQFGEVVEILSMPPVTPVPGALPWLLGVGNLRGNLFPVVDLKCFLEGERTGYQEGQRVLIMRQAGGDVALTIDELFGQRSFELHQQVEAGDIAQGRYAHFVDRAFRSDDHDWGVFSLSLLSRTPEFRQAAA